MLAINNIKENLALIQAQYPRGMNPVLTESEVQAYESEIGIRLPENICFLSHKSEMEAWIIIGDLYFYYFIVLNT